LGAALGALSIFVVGDLQARRSGHARRGDPHTQGRRRRRIGAHADEQPVAVATSLPQQRHVAGAEQIAHRVRALSRYREAMLIYSMGVSVDGFIADREGAFGWGAPSEELFRFHLARVRGLGGYLLGRRLYETMLAWETDPSMRDNELGAAFADVWCAIPKVVFSRTLDSVRGNARLAEASVAEEVAAALDATDEDVEIGGAGLAAQAFELGLVDELRVFRYPVVVGGGTPYLPPATEDVRLDLIESRTFDSRVIYERYQRVGGVL
jgi:dihydrofolate reductase